jgi:hypothetical protein
MPVITSLPLLTERNALQLLLPPALIAPFHTSRQHHRAICNSTPGRVLGVGNVLAAGHLVEDVHTIGGAVGAADAEFGRVVFEGVDGDGGDEGRRALGAGGAVAFEKGVVGVGVDWGGMSESGGEEDDGEVEGDG